MRTMVRSVVFAALLLGPAALSAQGQGRPGQRPGPGEERRSELAQQIQSRFMAQVADRLGLDAGQRAKLDTVLARGVSARQDLAQESRAVRMDLMRAVRSDSTDARRYGQLLERVQALRARERAIEDREARELATFLDARQQAMFLVMRMQFNDRVQRMRAGPPASRPGGPPGGMRF